MGIIYRTKGFISTKIIMGIAHDFQGLITGVFANKKLKGLMSKALCLFVERGGWDEEAFLPLHAKQGHLSI